MDENPKKYHVTDDGDVYRINEDGTFTSMGNTEKISSTVQTDATIPTTPRLSDNDKPIKPFVKKKHQGYILAKNPNLIPQRLL